MIHIMQNFQRQTLDLEYNDHPECCGKEMLPMFLDERLGAMTMTFFCTSCERWELK